MTTTERPPFRWSLSFNWTMWALPLAIGHSATEGYGFLVLGPIALEWRRD